MKTKARKIKFIEKRDIDKMIDAIPLERSRDWRDYALLHVLFSTGLRISEALALQTEPFIKNGVRKTMEVSIIGKGGKQRVVFFTPECLQAVSAFLEKRSGWEVREPELIFNMTPRCAQMAVKDRATAVKLGSWITPHKLRHSMATHVLRQGANIRIVQELLGHSSLTTTQVYAGVTNKDLLEAHKKFMV